MENKHFQAIPDDIKTQVIELLKQAGTLMAPYCVTLTTQQRKEISKMGDASLSFVSKALEHAIQHPEFLPSYMNTDEWKIDMADVNSTKQIAVALDDLNELVSDTRMESGHEAYQAALVFYHNVKRAATEGVPGAKPIYDILKTFFKERPPKQAAKTQ